MQRVKVDIPSLIDELNKIKQEDDRENIIEIPFEACLLINNNTDISCNYILKKQKQMQFKTNFYENSTPEHLLEGEQETNLLEDLNMSSYQKPWGKLEHELKINRAMHFVKMAITQNNLNSDESRQLRLLLVNAINNREITKKADVNYNESTGQLIDIHKLYFNKETRKYSIINNTAPKFIAPKKGSNGYVSHITKLSPEQNNLFKNFIKK